MQAAISVGRPIVQDEGFPWIIPRQLLVDLVVFPELLQFRLPLDGVRPHAEVSFR